VSVIPNIGCGHCPMCRQGLNQLCPEYEAFGISYDGGLSEYVRIPESAIPKNVIPVPEGFSCEEAALVEPFSCAWHAYDRLNTRPDDTVLIIGAGPIGACHVMISKLAGASKVIVADISKERLQEIRKFGADAVIDSAEEDLEEAVCRETEGRMPDVVITACSVPEMQQKALELAAPRGRINFFGGMPKGKEIVPLATNLIHYKELTVLATTGCSYRDYEAAMHIASSQKLPLGELVSKRYSIEQVQEAFAYAQSGQGMKTMIRFDC
ncbi:MAG: zinc-binding dehydrogenase, partial [Eubacterium sp.]|nr:zinc-binding dehydrogenase [Eubacterium sp.]